MGDRIPLIAGNWKMHKTEAEAVAAAQPLVHGLPASLDVAVKIAPPFTALEAVRDVLKGTSSVALGAQDVFWEDQGAYTGAISPQMIVAAGCRYVIIGHSERRQYFGDTDAAVHKKIGAALKHGLRPILCVGESESQREAGDTFSVLDKQIRNALEGYPSDALHGLVIAYEPVWAIGTGKTASNEQAQEVHAFIRAFVSKSHGNGLAKSIRIQYGGSVKPDNIKGLMAMHDVDGALVGGASLDMTIFSKIITYNQTS